MAEVWTEVKVLGVYFHQDTETVANHFVLLRDSIGRRVPIFTGQFEAWAISLALEEGTSERPFTHDAMLNLLALTGAALEDVCINDLREETFFAIGRVRIGDTIKEIDLRPSDAIALALRAGRPIYMVIRVVEAMVPRE